MRRTKAYWAVFGAFAVAAMLLGLWIAAAPRKAFSSQQSAGLETAGDAERGRLVFAAGDCSSCHATPGQDDKLALGGGLPLPSPYGTFRAPNISPDPVHGIGRWRTADLANALLEGTSPAGEHYYPALPYTSYTHMTVEDVRDLMAYLRTLKPVPMPAPPHELAWPFRIREVIGLWKLLYFDRGPLAPEPSHGEQWNRGRYLAEGPGHCAECHGSRNFLGAIKPETRYAGGVDPEGTGYNPNITPAHIGHWSEEQIEQVLTSGKTPDGRTIGSMMAGVVANIATLPANDRHALAAYVKSLPARPSPEP